MCRPIRMMVVEVDAILLYFHGSGCLSHTWGPQSSISMVVVDRFSSSAPIERLLHEIELTRSHRSVRRNVIRFCGDIGLDVQFERINGGAIHTSALSSSHQQRAIATMKLSWKQFSRLLWGCCLPSKSSRVAMRSSLPQLLRIHWPHTLHLKMCRAATASQFASERVKNSVIASEEHKSDYEAVMAAVSEHGSALKHESTKLKSKHERVTEAISKADEAQQYVSRKLKNNHESVMAAVSEACAGLEFASEDVKNNHDILMAAVSQDPLALQYASEDLKNNHEVVTAAVSSYPQALQYASEELKNNHEIVMAAVSKDPWALRFASEELRNKEEIIIAGISKCEWALQFASKELRNNHEFVMAAVSINPFALQGASEELRGNNEIVMKALSRNWNLYFDLSLELQAKLQNYRRSPLVTLNVLLLSGRCASMLCSVRSSLQSVLSECAYSLGLDPLRATATGVLLSGSATIHSLDQLEPWMVHNLTLVLSGLS